MKNKEFTATLKRLEENQKKTNSEIKNNISLSTITTTRKMTDANSSSILTSVNSLNNQSQSCSRIPQLDGCTPLCTPQQHIPKVLTKDKTFPNLYEADQRTREKRRKERERDLEDFQKMLEKNLNL